MRKLASVAIGVILGCVASEALAGAGQFRAHCQGRNEVPAIDSRGQCQAIFDLTQDGSGLQYRLIVANIEAVTQAHIHLAPAGENGPVVAFLFGFVPEGETVNGTLAQGVITSANLVGPLAGMALADLVAELEAGNAYVNVHTQAHPPGEVRGQIR